jgi:choice-of-anchor B domain-containing protein
MRIFTFILYAFLAYAFAFGAAAQPANFNLNRTGVLAYPMELSSLWGYEAGGRKYALVGTTAGVSIVDITVVGAPVEVDTILCTNSIWREIKTWGNYAYVVADNTADGILIIDLSNLPTNVSYEFVYPQTMVGGVPEILDKGHTLIFDENGVLYVSGSNINAGAVVMFDVSNPVLPQYLGTTAPVYAHDCYARGDTLWTADISAGMFSVYDISNKAAPVLLATQTTPNNFTHNLWISDDGQTLFTTDERGDAYVAAYDVSDLSNIREVDRFRSRGVVNTGTIPHNVHVLNDFLITAYYTDGVLVMDGSRPSNIIEVGRYDTYLQPRFGFFGVWGVYPYFSDGTIIASDMQTGLHIFAPNYVRACWLEGNIVEQGSLNPIFGASLRLIGSNANTQSDLSGNYATGLAQAGTYNVEVLKQGYIPQTVQATLQNGQLTILDFVLVPANVFGYSGTVLETGSNTPIAGAKVEVRSQNGLYDLQATTDINGNFSFPTFYTDNYNIIAGHWGHETRQTPLQSISPASSPLTILLDKGYKDEFVLDLGWSIVNTASAGLWERAIPRSPAIYNNNGQQGTPGADLPNDIGSYCYVTGNNESGQLGSADVDNGSTILASPFMDLLTYDDPYLYFHYWYVNESNIVDDTLSITMTNGSDSVRVAYFTGANRVWSAQQQLRIADYLPISNNMRMYFTASDEGAPTVVEAGIDLVGIAEAVNIIAVENLANTAAEQKMRAYPNPFGHTFTLETAADVRQINVYNALGQSVEQIFINNNGNTMTEVGANWAKGGLYLVCPDKGACLKVIKQ